MSLERLNSVTLQSPIELHGETVASVELRRPGTGELRGLSISAVLQMDVAAMMKLLPRITTPALDEAAIGALDPADFTDMAVRVTTFFVRRRQLEAQGRALTIEEAETAD